MNARFSFRLATLLVMLFAISLSSCKKDSNSDPSPDMGARVAGTYTYSELTTGGKTYPASETNLKGTITVTRKSASSVSIKMSLLLKSTNEVFADESADNVTLVDAGSGTIELSYQGTTIARVNGNKISTDGEDESGSAFTISATK